jgi:group I intron endonuclease
VIRIYRIICLATGKAYIGVTQYTLAVRWQAHRYHAKEKTRVGALQHAIRKYGYDAFRMELLAEAVDEREACAIERGLIAQYGTLAPNGYNMTSGGELEVGVKFSAETRDKLKKARASRSVHPNFIAAAGNWKGKKRPPTTIEKMRAAARARVAKRKGIKRTPHSPETRAKIGAASKRAHAEGRMPKKKSGWRWSQEVKALIGQRSRERAADPEYRAKLRASAAAMAKLSCDEVATIKRLMLSGSRTGHLAALFNVSPSLISQIRTGKAWSHVAPAESERVEP